jgi:hypothetical protein
MTSFPNVLQLSADGRPQTWITYEDSAYHYAKENVIYSLGAMDFDLHGGTNAKTGKQSILTINTIIALRGIPSQKAMRHYNRVPLSNKTLFRRDHNICGYCGKEHKNEMLTRDHVKPTSKGGKNVWTNVVTACARCNKAKDARTPEAWGVELIYLPYNPCRNEWLILQNRRIISDQMVFLQGLIKNPDSRSLN